MRVSGVVPELLLPVPEEERVPLFGSVEDVVRVATLDAGWLVDVKPGRRREFPEGITVDKAGTIWGRLDWRSERLEMCDAMKLSGVWMRDLRFAFRQLRRNCDADGGGSGRSVESGIVLLLRVVPAA